MSEICVVLKRSPFAQREARSALRLWLDGRCVDRVEQDALAILAELVTNAVVHARSDPTVVAMYDDGRLRIEVHDNDPSPPNISPTVGAGGGFGLRIVAGLADAWGWLPTAPGKHVWAEMLC